MNRPKEIEAEFINRIRQHCGILHKICFIYAKNDADREDLYQEIVLQLWKSYPSFKGRSEFSTWMYRVALNTAIVMVKKRPLLTEDVTRLNITYQPEVSMDYSEDIRTLYKAISQLSKVEKAIILLWLEEKSYQEMAEALGISAKNVSVRLVRIKNKLAELIQKLQ